MDTGGRIFYGWIVVAAVFVTMAVTAGLGFYNVSVLLSAAVDELDADVSVVSGAPALFFGLTGVLGFLVAPMMDRIDIRWFLGIGGVLGAASLYGLRWVDSVPDLYIFFATFAVGNMLAGILPCTTLVARWFDRRRSLALSIASTGLSVGGVLITPVVATFIIDDGLASVATALALIWFLAITPMTLLFIRSSPQAVGLEPDGVPTPPVPSVPVGARFSDALASRYFRMLCITFALIFLAQVGGIAQLFNHADERLGSNTAALTLSALALSSIIGRLAGGVVVLRLDARRLALVLSLVQAVALLIIADADTRPIMVIGAALFGLSIGNLLMLQPLLLADAFGIREYSRIYAFNMLIATVGIAGGPLILGVLRDLADYRFAFIAAAIGNAIGFLTLLWAGPTETARRLWA